VVLSQSAWESVKPAVTQHPGAVQVGAGGGLPGVWGCSGPALVGLRGCAL
jgi:hypothetical protein